MRRNILFQHETVFDRFELVPEGERGQMTAEKCEPSVSEFEAFDNDGDNNDTRAPGHENEYLVPAAPEQFSLVTSAVTSPGSV